MSKLLSSMASGITLDLKCNYSGYKVQPGFTQGLQYQLVKFAKVLGCPFSQNTKVFNAACIGRPRAYGTTTVRNTAAKGKHACI